MFFRWWLKMCNVNLMLSLLRRFGKLFVWCETSRIDVKRWITVSHKCRFLRSGECKYGKEEDDLKKSSGNKIISSKNKETRSIGIKRQKTIELCISIFSIRIWLARNRSTVKRHYLTLKLISSSNRRTK